MEREHNLLIINFEIAQFSGVCMDFFNFKIIQVCGVNVSFKKLDVNLNVRNILQNIVSPTKQCYGSG